MSKLFIIQIVCYFSLSFFSQNLINNGSFEEFSNCPDASGQLEYSLGWLNPTSSTPDFFHLCSEIVFTPNCCLNFQIPKHGSAYVGVWLYSEFNLIREYTQTKLSKTLNANKCYFVSMFINSMNWSKFGINGIGFYFSNDSINQIGNNLLLDYNPQIYSQINTFDTLNWLQISGIITSSGTEKFMTIGNFFPDSLINIQIYNENAEGTGAYYLIDDVILLELGENYAGKDTTIYTGQSVYLGFEVENLPCTWKTLAGETIASNVSGILVSPTETTTYICEQNFCNEIMYDTVTVFVNGVGLAESLKSPKIIISPNPNYGTFSIELNTPIAIQELHILDALGRKIIVLDEKQTNFEVKLQKGVYFLEFISEKSRVLEKVVVN
jgi:hypothetical protein